MQESYKLTEDKTKDCENNYSSNLDLQANQQETVSNVTEPKNKNFNFIKKKNNTNSTVDNNVLDKDNDSKRNNLDEINNVNNISNNDLNSDTKSFKSLKINNNFKNENISVNLDAGNDDEMNKSVINENNNTINLGGKNGFKYLKNKDAVKDTNANSNNFHKLSFLKKNQEKEKENEKRETHVNKQKTEEEDIKLTVILI